MRKHFVLICTLLSTATLALTFVVGSSTPSRANCLVTSGGGTVEAPADGSTVSCDDTPPNPFTIGVGAASGANDLTVNIEAGSWIDVDAAGVRAVNNSQITNDGEINSGFIGIFAFTNSSVTNNGIIVSNDEGISGADGNTFINNGQIVAGTNGIEAEFNNFIVNDLDIIAGTRRNGTGILVDATSRIINNGNIISQDGRGISAGNGSTIVNNGTIEATDGGIVFFESEITNNGTITASVGVIGSEDFSSRLLNNGTITANSFNLFPGGELINTGVIETIGTDSLGYGIASRGNVINAGTISGSLGVSLLLFDNNDSLILRNGSIFNGAIVGGSGVDEVFLEERGSEDDTFIDFEELIMRGDDWILSGDSTFLDTQVGSGILRINGGLSSPVVINSGGTLSGDGIIAGEVTNNGTMAPGDPLGSFVINGLYNQGSDGALVIEIGGYDPGNDFDVLVAQDAFLDGLLDVDLVGSFLPALGATFDILLADTITDMFSGENLPVFDGRTFDVIYSDEFVRLLTVEMTPMATPASLALLVPGLVALGWATRRRVH